MNNFEKPSNKTIFEWWYSIAFMQGSEEKRRFLLRQRDMGLNYEEIYNLDVKMEKEKLDGR